jgi:FAD:protein FMN transferase
VQRLAANPERAAIRLALDAMRTRFEIVLPGVDSVAPLSPASSDRSARSARSAGFLHAAGEAALAEIAAADRQLSFFRSDSWLGRINREAARGPCKIPAAFFELLQLCAEVHLQSEGAFDPSVGRWQKNSSFKQVRLDSATRTVEFLNPNLQLDLGGIGKGWAIDQAIEVLQEAGVQHALIHGGTSTVRTLGPPPGQIGWRIDVQGQASVEFCHAALSISESYPRQMETQAPAAADLTGVAVDATAFGDSASPTPPTPHIINPHDGQPLRLPCLAAVTAPTAAAADAWSTALLVQKPSRFSWKSLR